MMLTRQPALLDSTRQHPFLIILDLMLGYFGYGFLTFPIVLTLFMLVFDYLIIFGSKLPSFLDYIPEQWVSRIPEDLTANDITGAYMLLTALFWAVVRLARELFSLVRRLVGRAPLLEAVQLETLPFQKQMVGFLRLIPRRLFWSVVPTIAVFLVAFIAMPFSDGFQRDDLPWFYVILIIFCVIAVVMIVSHVLFDGVAQLILLYARHTLNTAHLQIGE